ncbi:AraC family transcriptional regulator [Deinococcus malanensis]|uniref:DNA-3-methyladenine glycosylase II n=1 Tax=Deinococcus malanensis TaxID=1706855 RepID=A0ABQ2EYZ3_9DEIO|nr:Ada metal-binding domain-containing protein [Deinococcus malanensis]GGK27602.1 AraC family transcriptional regulator [Deinococcus malanensis]
MPWPLPREFMLKRMLAADANCDGRFITGVTSTGIYCLPSCRARKPRPENVVFYPAQLQARAAGLRPCLRCRPDDHAAGLDPHERLVEQLIAGVDLARVRHVADLAAQAGVGSSKLRALFQTHLHTTPADWLAMQRVRAARARLLGSGQTAANIAFEVGFESLSAFGEQFRRWNAMTPQAYRRLPSGTFTLRLPDDYPLEAMLRDLGRDHTGTTVRVQGDTCQAGLRLPSGPRSVRVAFTGTQALVQVDGPVPLNAEDAGPLHEQVLGLLGLKHAPARFEAQLGADPALAALIEGRRGLRVPLVPDLFDGVVWAVLGQQVTFVAACTLRHRLTVLAGTLLAGSLYAPATPQAVLTLSVDELRGLGLTVARAQLLRHFAGQVASGELILEQLATGTAARATRTLLALPGVGPWTANYLLLRVLGFQDSAPVGDSGLIRGLQRFFGLPQRPGPREAGALMARFAPHRSLATFHLWQHASLEPS